MKSVIISINPKDCELIANGKMTIKVLKSRPKIETPFKCYIYCTNGLVIYGNGKQYIMNSGEFLKESAVEAFENSSGFCKWNGKVIGEFVCDWITEITPHCDIKDFVNQYIHGYPASLGENDCLSFQEMKSYLGNKKGYDWHISDLKLYYKPKELSEFKRWNRTEENSPLRPYKMALP